MQIREIKPAIWTDIIFFEDSLIEPIDYTGTVSLKELSIEQRKKVFIQEMLPAILIVKFGLQQQYNKVLDLAEKDSSSWNKRERKYLDSLFIKYKTREHDELLVRLQTHPSSLVIAQAALESAWGTSRFYTDAFNVFGTWSFNVNEPRVPSYGLRDGSPVYLKKHSRLTASVSDYFLTLARGPYADFRKERNQTTDVYALTVHLKNYSELNHEYIDRVNRIIKSNDLTDFDNYRIDPQFINRGNLFLFW